MFEIQLMMHLCVPFSVGRSVCINELFIFELRAFAFEPTLNKHRRLLNRSPGRSAAESTSKIRSRAKRTVYTSAAVPKAYFFNFFNFI